MNKKKIYFISVCRSDYLRQLPIINYLKTINNIYLKILITGSHSHKLYGETLNDIKKSNVLWENCCPKKYSLKTKDISSNLKECLGKIDKTIKKDCPDILVLFGDRYEFLAGALAAFGKKILIVHIHGGSVTLGAFDDQVRHSLTKLSHIHLTSIKQYADRIQQMGEEKWRIKVVGAPGIDYLKNFSKNLKDKYLKKFIIKNNEKFVLVCFHPETTNLENLKKQLKEIKIVLNKIKKKIIITYPNSDPGSKEIINFFKTMVSKNKKKMIFLKNLRYDYYFLLKNCNYILGNSSSGIVEATTFSTPVINLGIRQTGKLIPKNVISCKYNSSSILKAIKKINNKDFKKKIHNIKNPYGDGNSGKRIGKFLKNLKIKNYFFQKKFVTK
tara:strand:+ start:77 stop:1231 length:1155 start_codon:yes stop_codon:yes gene_type:complete